MSYSIHFNELDKRIEIFYFGELSMEALEQSIPQIKLQCQQTQCWDVLSDIHQAKYKVKDSEEFVLTQALAELFPAHVRIAVLADEVQIPIERIRLLEESAALHDITLKIFSDPRDVYAFFTS